MNCLIFCFNTFDLFAVLYLGNEITAASADLMYCVFESDWVGQSKTVTMDVIILTEKLKKPQELVLLKLYPMNLVTFTSVIQFWIFADLIFRCRMISMILNSNHRFRSSRTACLIF